MSMTAAAPMSRDPGPVETLRARFRPLRWFRRRMLRKPASTLALSLGALLTGVIVMNALALQTERHPAPMFTSMIEERPAVQPAPAAPVPPARPEATEKKRETAARAPVKEEAPRAAPMPSTAKDQMLAIIKGGSPEAVIDQSARSIQIQRALNKAGYGPLKEDGVFGAGSRAALERFESDRKLPPRGETQGRSIRELSRVSGVAID